MATFGDTMRTVTNYDGDLVIEKLGLEVRTHGRNQVHVNVWKDARAISHVELNVTETLTLIQDLTEALKAIHMLDLLCIDMDARKAAAQS